MTYMTQNDILCSDNLMKVWNAYRLMTEWFTVMFYIEIKKVVKNNQWFLSDWNGALNSECRGSFVLISISEKEHVSALERSQRAGQPGEPLPDWSVHVDHGLLPDRRVSARRTVLCTQSAVAQGSAPRFSGNRYKSMRLFFLVLLSTFA